MKVDYFKRYLSLFVETLTASSLIILYSYPSFLSHSDLLYVIKDASYYIHILPSYLNI
jgi:hypothetical protein